MGLGGKLRSSRIAPGLTIPDVASRAALSQSYISQLERDQANPSLSALTRVAEALELDLAAFFADNPIAPEPNNPPGEDTIPTRVVKHDRRRTLIYPEVNVRYELLVPDLQHALQVHRTVCPVGTCSEAPISHKGEEVALVIRGVLEMTVQQSRFLLEAGDTIRFAGSALDHHPAAFLMPIGPFAREASLRASTWRRWQV